MNSSLLAFRLRVSRSGRITADDVKALQREILPGGVASREEADLLLALDYSTRRGDPRFTDWLVAALVDFAVWGERPTGRVDAQMARWLASWLTQAPNATSRRLAREIMREAQDVDAALLAGVAGEAPDSTVVRDGGLRLAA